MGGELARESVGDFIDDLAKFNAGANVINTAPDASAATKSSGLRDAHDPRRAVGRRCGEAGPVPVASFSLQLALSGPMKRLARIAVQTRESFESSASQTVLTTLLDEGMSRLLIRNFFPRMPAPLSCWAWSMASLHCRPKAPCSAISISSAPPSRPSPPAGSFTSRIRRWPRSSTTGKAGPLPPMSRCGRAWALRRALSSRSIPAHWHCFTATELDTRSSKEVLLHMDDVPNNIALPGVPHRGRCRSPRYVSNRTAPPRC